MELCLPLMGIIDGHVIAIPYSFSQRVAIALGERKVEKLANCD